MTLCSLRVLQKLQNLSRTCRCLMFGPSFLPRCVLFQLLGPPPLRPPISGQDSDQYRRLQENRSASYSWAPPNRHRARHAAAERGPPLTPDLWPLTRLSDGLSIPSGLAAVIVAWSSLDMLCLEWGTAGRPAAPGGPASLPVSTRQHRASPEQQY